MNIGLFFGSFNPIHIGHLILANHIVENSNLDKIWFIVSPHNPFKEKKTLLEDHHRLEMVNLAIQNYPKFQSSDIEFHLPKPSYTIDTLVVLKDKYPDNNFALLIGQDNILSFHKWKNYEQILKNYKLLVYPRITEPAKEKTLTHPNIEKISAPIIEISSTMIREMIKKNKNVYPLVPPEVFHYLDGSNLYK